ncbi:MAG: hypothetical protein R3F33_01600 [Planctomycetota bacterium]
MIQLILPLTLQAAALSPELHPPVLLFANDQAIDVVTGHAAPHFIDFDGDGLRDLLVGEFGDGDFPVERLPESERSHPDFAQGRLRIYRNVGSNTAPEFKDFEYLRAGKEFASIPTT